MHCRLTWPLWIPTMYQKRQRVPRKALTISCCYGCARRLWNSLPVPGESLCPPTVFVWKEPHSPGDCHNIVVSKCIKARQGAVGSGDHQPSCLASVQGEGITLIEITADSTVHSRYLNIYIFLQRTQKKWPTTLQWHHNGRDGISNHQPHDCLLKHLFRHRWKKISKLHVTGLFEGNSPVTGEFSAQRASNAENVSIWWRHYGAEYFPTHWWLIVPFHKDFPLPMSSSNTRKLANDL